MGWDVKGTSKPDLNPKTDLRMRRNGRRRTGGTIRVRIVIVFPQTNYLVKVFLRGNRERKPLELGSTVG